MTAAAADSQQPLDAERVRADFPMFRQQMRGKPLVYLDSAASSQKPQPVIDAVNHFYTNAYSSVHRGVYHLSDLATRDYEAVRQTTADFLGADSAREIVFVRNTTEAINLVAQTWGRTNIGAGDEILISHMEHGSTPLGRLVLSAIVRQHSEHHAGRDGEELPAIVVGLPLADQHHVRLVDQRRRLEGNDLRPVAELSAQVGGGRALQVVVDHRHQLVQGTFPARLHLPQHQRDVAHRGHRDQIIEKNRSRRDGRRRPLPVLKVSMTRPPELENWP